MKNLMNVALACAVMIVTVASCQQKNKESVKSAEIKDVSPEPIASNMHKPAPEPGKAAFKFEVTEYDFGTVNEGDVVEYVFKFENTGEEPLIISDARASCGCTVPKKPEGPIAPGETGELGVKFNTNGKKNQQLKTITITANTNPVTTKLALKGMVTPKETNNPS